MQIEARQFTTVYFVVFEILRYVAGIVYSCKVIFRGIHDRVLPIFVLYYYINFTNLIECHKDTIILQVYNLI